jgi:preprotein translocase subunit SecA
MPTYPQGGSDGGAGNPLDAFAKLVNKDPAEQTRQEYQPLVDEVNALEASLTGLSDDGLREKVAALRERAKGGASLDGLRPEAFALVREASRRVLGLRPFDVQIIGGAILNSGAIAEMGTGEGKTLVAVLPAFLNALAGQGVHVVTVNDYLARRDAEWVGQVHRFLGLSVGLIQAEMEPPARRAAYQCDVTYVTNSELGFDFLRDNLATSPEELVLRPFNYCCIDEVDSILIDEARTPLIISGPAEAASDRYVKAAKIAEAFALDVHYTVDEKQKSVLLTEEGFEAAEEILGVSDLYDPREQWATYILNAIKAEELYVLDRSYIVKKGEVMIVDEFTGRVMEGRRWSDGLHQAMEAKEKVEIQNESVTLASVTYQNFFLSYPKVGGMTGTAETEAVEFENIYGIDVVVVPPNRTRSREDNQDVVFKSVTAKWKAVITEVERMHKKGRPVLVGTTSVELSEGLSRKLSELNIPHELLNAKPENVERESEIVAQGGRRGAVTIATNMAGRGTDILLGGNPEFMARLMVRSMLMPAVVAVGDDEIAFEKKGSVARKKASAASTGDKWAVSPKLFPCELSADTAALLEAAVANAAEAWGGKSLEALEAEDRLSVACERAPTDDATTLALREAFNAIMGEYEGVTSVAKEAVKALGGLHVVGTERHESRRVDNQLRGRAGRQGDPGSSRYFLSLEDNLFRIFGGERIQGLMAAFNVEDLPIESGMLTNALDGAQKKVETYFFDIRKQLFEYDQVLNQQRQKVYADRRVALSAEDDEIGDTLLRYSDETVDDIMAANVPDPADVSDELWESLMAKFGQYCKRFTDTLTTADVIAMYKAEGYDAVYDRLVAIGREAVEEKRKDVERVQPGLVAEAARYFLLTQTDNLWKEQLQAMRFIQQAVGLRGYAQKDPLTEYKLEGFALFKEMQAQVRRNVIFSFYNFEANRMTPVEEGEGKSKKGKGKAAEASKDEEVVAKAASA